MLLATVASGSNLHGHLGTTRRREETCQLELLREGASLASSSRQPPGEVLAKCRQTLSPTSFRDMLGGLKAESIPCISRWDPEIQNVWESPLHDGKETTGLPGTLRNWGSRPRTHDLRRMGVLTPKEPDSDGIVSSRWRMGSGLRSQGWVRAGRGVDGKGVWVGWQVNGWVGVHERWISTSSHSRRTQREKKRSRRLCGPWIGTQIPPEGQRVGRKFSKSKLMDKNAWCLIKLPRKPQPAGNEKKKNEMRFYFQCSLETPSWPEPSCRILCV